MQEALKCMYDFLEINFPEDRYIWDLRKINKWRKTINIFTWKNRL